MNEKIVEFCKFTSYQTKKEQERIKAEKEEEKRLAEEAKLLAGRRGIRSSSNNEHPLKSAFARKQNKSGSIKDGQSSKQV